MKQRRGWIWNLALALVPILVVLGATLHPYWWKLLAVNHMRPYFLDLVAILAAGEAHVAGLNVYAVNPFDPFGRPHVYGPLWVYLGDLGLKVSDAPWLGAVLSLVFVVTLAAILAPRTRGTFLMASALMAGPPVLLALERGNNDLIVVLLLAAAAWALARVRWSGIVCAAAVLLFAGALKIYPAAALPVLVGKRNLRLAILVCAAAVVACVVGGWEWRQEFHRAMTLAPEPTSISAYGLYVSYLTWNSLFATRGWLILGAVIAAAIFGYPILRRVRDQWRSVPLVGFRANVFIVAALCWIVCYLLTSNYRYRFVLLLLPSALWLSRAFRLQFRALAWWQLAGWAVVAWVDVIMRPLAQASLQPAPGTSPQWLTAVVGFEQGLVIVLTLALAIAVTGWFFRIGARARSDLWPR